MTDRLDFLLWIAVPYAAFAVFVTGHFWRYRRDQLGWSARSTQLLERRLLRWGSLLFHLGMLAVLGGHVLGHPRAGLVDAGARDRQRLPRVGGDRRDAVRRRDDRRLRCARLPAPRACRASPRRRPGPTASCISCSASRSSAGCSRRSGFNVLASHGYEYRETVAPWFRGLGLLSPDPALMTGAAAAVSDPCDVHGRAVRAVAVHPSRARLERPGRLPRPLADPLPAPAHAPARARLVGLRARPLPRSPRSRPGAVSADSEPTLTGSTHDTNRTLS